MNPPDPFMNPFIPNNDQMSFVFKNYPNHTHNPTEILQWLYQMAEYNEGNAEAAAYEQ